MHSRKILCSVLLCCAMFGAAGAVELTGTVPVNVTADTAADAKTQAFNSARRDVIARELRAYAIPEQLDAAIKNSSNEDLMNIISSDSVAGERTSDTTYTANISFVIDGDAARRWMDANSVQHWLPSSSSAMDIAPANSVVFNANLLQPVSDWIDLNAVARAVGVDVATRSMVGNRVSFIMSDTNAKKFISMLQENGWHVARDVNGYKIWK